MSKRGPWNVDEVNVDELKLGKFAFRDAFFCENFVELFVVVVVVVISVDVDVNVGVVVCDLLGVSCRRLPGQSCLVRCPRGGGSLLCMSIGHDEIYRGI